MSEEWVVPNHHHHHHRIGIRIGMIIIIVLLLWLQVRLYHEGAPLALYTGPQTTAVPYVF
jgi:hypothetical protein